MHIDIDPSSISKNVKVDLPIVGSADQVLDGMLKLLEESAERNDAAALDSWWNEIKCGVIVSVWLMKPQQNGLSLSK